MRRRESALLSRLWFLRGLLNRRAGHVILSGAARALPGGNRFDDEFVRALRIEGDFGVGFCREHESFHGGFVESRCLGQADVFNYVAAALQALFRVGQAAVGLQKE